VRFALAQTEGAPIDFAYSTPMLAVDTATPRRDVLAAPAHTLPIPNRAAQFQHAMIRPRTQAHALCRQARHKWPAFGVEVIVDFTEAYSGCAGRIPR
jgi:hypothetical protein